MKKNLNRGKMVEVTVQFWTQPGIPQNKVADGRMLAWESGEVYIKRDRKWSIKSTRSHMFKSRQALDAAITDVLNDAGVILLKSRQTP